MALGALQSDEEPNLSVSPAVTVVLVLCGSRAENPWKRIHIHTRIHLYTYLYTLGINTSALAHITISLLCGVCCFIKCIYIYE